MFGFDSLIQSKLDLIGNYFSVFEFKQLIWFLFFIGSLKFVELSNTISMYQIFSTFCNYLIRECVVLELDVGFLFHYLIVICPIVIV